MVDDRWPPVSVTAEDNGPPDEETAEDDDDLEAGWPRQPLERAMFEAIWAAATDNAYRALCWRRGQEARML